MLYLLFLTILNNKFLGQRKIKDSSVLIVGAGGLGCPAALYLACAGIGHIGIVDYDNIEINNLHRQLLYTEASIGTFKVIAAAESIAQYDYYDLLICCVSLDVFQQAIQMMQYNVKLTQMFS